MMLLGQLESASRGLAEAGVAALLLDLPEYGRVHRRVGCLAFRLPVALLEGALNDLFARERFASLFKHLRRGVQAAHAALLALARRLRSCGLLLALTTLALALGLLRDTRALWRRGGLDLRARALRALDAHLAARLKVLPDPALAAGVGGYDPHLGQLVRHLHNVRPADHDVLRLHGDLRSTEKLAIRGHGVTASQKPISEYDRRRGDRITHGQTYHFSVRVATAAWPAGIETQNTDEHAAVADTTVPDAPVSSARII